MAIDPATTSTLSRSPSARSPRAKRPSRGGGGAADPPRIELQRARKLIIAAEAVRELPFEGVPVAGDNGRGGVSRQAFDDHPEGREACLLAAFQEVLALAGERASVAFQAQEGWVDRVRAGLLALLEFFDEEPALAQFLVVASAQAGPAVLARRGEVLDRLALVLDYERAPARGYPPPLTAEAVVSGVLGVLQGRLSKRDPGALLALAGPLMSFVVLPFLGARAARRELSRPVDATPAPVQRSVALDLLQDPGKRLNHHRTMRVLRIIAAEPGLSNSGVALRAGVKDPGHISRLLSRLARLGLIENTRDPRNRVAAKAWQLTVSGEELESAIRHEPPAPVQRSVALDLLADSGARLNHRAVSILMVIGAQPGLSNTDVAVRTDIRGKGQASTLLARLARHGLIENTRTDGRENVWRLTASGGELETTIREQTPDAGR